MQYGPISDAGLEKLGDFFVKHRVRERFGWTFEQFIQKVGMS